MMRYLLNHRKSRPSHVVSYKFLKTCAGCLFAIYCLYCVFSTTTADKPSVISYDGLGSSEKWGQDIHANIREAARVAFSTITVLPEEVILDSDIRRLQELIHCAIKEKPLRVRSRSHKPAEFTTLFNLEPNACVESFDMLPSGIMQPWDVSELCDYLLSKRILLVGSRTTYNLHDRLIDFLPSGASGSQSRCPGAGLCTWHEICMKVDDTDPAPPRISPPNRHKTPPRDLSKSAILRFALSMTLRQHPPTSPIPYVSPITGIREHDAHDWPEKARRADLLILAKAPVPAPAWSYGNVSNASLTVRLPAPGSVAYALAQRFFKVGQYHGVFGAAWKSTTIKWLPELMETLTFLRKISQEERQKIVIWLGLRYLEEGCAWMNDGVDGKSDSRLIQLLRSVDMSNRCMYHNAQVYMQHRLLEEILPRFGILYIPGANPAPSFGSSSIPLTGKPPQEQHLLPEMSLTEDLIVTASDDAEQSFLNGLVTILRWYEARPTHVT